MNNKVYIYPEITVIDMENDVITTSDIEAGIETMPLPETGGSWEVL